jgi:hypothetical protein
LSKEIKKNPKKEIKKIPYKPMPFRDGHKLIRLFEEDFVDKIGNQAVITKADFFDKKGKEVLGYTLYVKWKN